MNLVEQLRFALAAAFAPNNGWRALGFLMALALAYNGLSVGTEYKGVPLAPFLSSSLAPLAWSNLAWAVLFVSIGLVAAIVEVIPADCGLRCFLQGLVFILFVLAALAVTFSPQPAVTAGRYVLGGVGALLAGIAHGRQEKIDNASEALARAALERVCGTEPQREKT